jgi:predicted outer membrane repeat protein
MKAQKSSITMFLLLMSLFISVTASATVFVKWDAGGSNNGSSWANAYTDLKIALGAVGSGDTVWVAGGTYTPTTTTDRYATFTLVDDTFLYGGFAGSETSLSQRDISANETILSGEIGAPGIADNSHNVVTSPGGATGILDGFTVTSGNDLLWGAGIDNGAGDFTFVNLIIKNNHAGQGGGMYNAGQPVMQNVAFIDNSASSGGGGLCNTLAGDPVLIECAFEENSAASDGGAIWHSGTGLTLTDCDFSDNTSSDHGGAMICFTDAEITGCSFDSNHAIGGSGGGIYLDNSDPTIENVVFTDNVAFTSGGGIFVDINSTLELFNAVLQGNEAGAGGGVAFTAGLCKIANAVFYNNSAIQGGGIDINSGVVYLTNVTFHSNAVTFSGGGLRNRQCALVIANTIFWQNSADFSGDEIANYAAGNTDIAHSLIRNCGGSGSGWDTNLGNDNGDNIDADPLYMDEVTGNLRLTTGSPAINAGDNSAPFIQPTDLDGNPRILDSIVDMGAYEFDPTTSVDVSTPLPDRIIQRVFPNPFNPTISIVLDGGNERGISLSVYDVRGRLVKSLLRNENIKDSITVRWNGRDSSGQLAASGIYFIVMRSVGNNEVRKVTLVK